MMRLFRRGPKAASPEPSEKNDSDSDAHSGDHSEGSQASYSPEERASDIRSEYTALEENGEPQSPEISKNDMINGRFSRRFGGSKPRMGSDDIGPASSSSSSHSSETQTFVSVESNDFDEHLNHFDNEYINPDNLTIGLNINKQEKEEEPPSPVKEESEVEVEDLKQAEELEDVSDEKPSEVEPPKNEKFDTIENLDKLDKYENFNKGEGPRVPYLKFRNDKTKFSPQRKKQIRTGYMSPSYQYYPGNYNYHNYHNYHHGAQNYGNMGDFSLKDSGYSTPIHHQLDHSYYKEDYYHSPANRNMDKTHMDGYPGNYHGYDSQNLVNYPNHYMNNYQGPEFEDSPNYSSPKTGYDYKAGNLHFGDPKAYTQLYKPQSTVKPQVKPRQSSALQILNPDTGEVVNSTKETTSSKEEAKVVTKEETKEEVKEDTTENKVPETKEENNLEGETEPTTMEVIRHPLPVHNHIYMNQGVKMPTKPAVRTRLRIINMPINPTEVIMTLSELHPHKDFMLPPKEHSRSNQRKIHNVPLSTSVGSSSSGDHSLEDLEEPDLNRNNYLDKLTGLPTGESSDRLGGPEDFGVPKIALDTFKFKKLTLPDEPGMNVYSINRLLYISLSMKNFHNDEMGNFKLVPLNYLINNKKKNRKDNKWRSEVSIEKEEITTCKLRKTNLSKEEQYKRSIRTLLNKLTVENFLVVSEKIANLYKEATDQEEVDIVVDLLQEKATLELDYSDMYADLAFLLRYSFNDNLDVGSKTTCFHKTLLNKCQESFEEISTNHTLNKDFILGNIRFMGELFLRKILSITILKRISYTLLTSKSCTSESSDQGSENSEAQEKAEKSSVDETKEGDSHGSVSDEKESQDALSTGDPEKDRESVENDRGSSSSEKSDEKDLIFHPPDNLIECFSELLTTIGYTVDQIPGGSEMLDEYVGILITLKNSNAYPTRINFKIQDLIDLRKRNWKKKLFKEKATSVSQIHKQVEQEHLKGGTNSQEGKYVTAGLQTNRHYTQYLLNKRQQALDSMVNGVYAKSEGPQGDNDTNDGTLYKKEGDFIHEILKVFLTRPNQETLQSEWQKYKPTEDDVVNVFEQMLKNALSNKTLEMCLVLSELVSFVLTKLVDSEILRAKLLNMLCDGYVVRLSDEVLDNPWALVIVSKIVTLLFCNFTGEARNLLEKMSIPRDFSTSKKLTMNVIQGTREQGGDVGFTRRVFRRHLYSTFPQQNLLFLDEI